MGQREDFKGLAADRAARKGAGPGSKKRLSAPPPLLLAALSDKSLKFPCSSTAFLSFDK